MPVAYRVSSVGVASLRRLRVPALACALLLLTPLFAGSCAAEGNDTFVLEDFESTPFLWTGPAQPDDTLVKSGQGAMRWDAGPGGKFLRLTEMPHDWSDVNRLSFWCHSFEATDARIMIRLPSENPDSEGIDYYWGFFHANWTGWKKITFDLPRDCLPNRTPVGWGSIDYIELRCEGWSDLKPVAGTLLNFDDFALWHEPAGDELILADFEHDLFAWNNLKRGTEQVKEGDYSGLWDDTVADPTIRNAKNVPPDWTGYTHVAFWLHSQTANRAEILLYLSSENEATDGVDYYSHKLTLDWEGWKEVTIPLARMKVGRKPLGWKHIDSIAFHSMGWGMVPRPDTRLHFDCLALRKAKPQAAGHEQPAQATPRPPRQGFQWKREGQRLMLDDFESGVGKWLGLTLDEETVKSDKASAAWLDARQVTDVYAAVPGDWSEYDRLRLALHSAKANRAKISVLVDADNPETDEPDYYRWEITANWTGWKELERPFVEFETNRRPLGWTRVGKLRLSSVWGATPLPGTSLRLDDVCLYREPVRMESLGYSLKKGDGRPTVDWKLRVENRLERTATPTLSVETVGLEGADATLLPFPRKPFQPGESRQVTVAVELNDDFALAVPVGEPPAVALNATVDVDGERHHLSTRLPGGAVLFAALKPGPHPRLFFTKDEIPKLREKLKHPQVAEIWTTILKWMGDLRKHSANVRAATTNETKRRQVAWSMHVNAFAYLMAGEQVRLDAALSGLEALVECDTWLAHGSVASGRPLDHRAATAIRLVAETYDWLYDEIPEATRAKVRDRLRQFCFEAGAEAWK